MGLGFLILCAKFTGQWLPLTFVALRGLGTSALIKTPANQEIWMAWGGGGAGRQGTCSGVDLQYLAMLFNKWILKDIIEARFPAYLCVPNSDPRRPLETDIYCPKLEFQIGEYKKNGHPYNFCLVFFF